MQNHNSLFYWNYSNALKRVVRGQSSMVRGQSCFFLQKGLRIVYMFSLMYQNETEHAGID